MVLMNEEKSSWNVDVDVDECRIDKSEHCFSIHNEQKTIYSLFISNVHTGLQPIILNNIQNSQ